MQVRGRYRTEAPHSAPAAETEEDGRTMTTIQIVAAVIVCIDIGIVAAALCWPEPHEAENHEQAVSNPSSKSSRPGVLQRLLPPQCHPLTAMLPGPARRTFQPPLLGTAGDPADRAEFTA